MIGMKIKKNRDGKPDVTVDTVKKSEVADRIINNLTSSENS